MWFTSLPVELMPWSQTVSRTRAGVWHPGLGTPCHLPVSFLLGKALCKLSWTPAPLSTAQHQLMAPLLSWNSSKELQSSSWGGSTGIYLLCADWALPEEALCQTGVENRKETQLPDGRALSWLLPMEMGWDRSAPSLAPFIFLPWEVCQAPGWCV